jgi:predicted membrane metal-binding protein
VILGGCVVEPPAISGERERFLLELAPQARAQVTLYTKEGEALPPLRYGQNIELDARVRKPRNYGNPGDFDYQHFLARQEHLLDGQRRRRHGPHPGRAAAARRS